MADAEISGEVHAAPVDLSGARLIDANKLLAAMERAQQRKKKARAKQMAEMAEAEARAAAEAEK
ncbi:hypothetical protein PENTCL1PPCAC_11905, partial [Pristionchus entomophagus]